MFPDFNSIKVRLKQPRLVELLLSGFPFQFHKGTIKTFGSGKDDRRLLQFQFHKGTIKTFMRVNLDALKANFNSIKVRLKQMMRSPSPMPSTFQFHKGTIKTMVCI